MLLFPVIERRARFHKNIIGCCCCCLRRRTTHKREKGLVFFLFFFTLFSIELKERERKKRNLTARIQNRF